MVTALQKLQAHGILELIKEHKKHGCDENCTVNLFCFRDLICRLLDRNLTKEELEILK